MSLTVLAAASSLRKALSGFDPEVLSGRDCARVAEELAATEKACGAARLLAASRAVEAGTHKDRGFSDGASWLAHHVGLTGAEARQALSTAGALEGCPSTKEALLAGQVSIAQAEEITRAEKETPGAERQLLKVARSSDLSKLRETAREHRAANTDVRELDRRQHAARHFRHWRDRLGMICFKGALPPKTGVGFIHRLEAATERLRREARESGSRPERFEAHAADALVQMPGSSAQRRQGRAELVIVCDLFAWRRGHVHRGEPCHIIDGGPIPVEVARELARDAFVKEALHDGVQIHKIKHFGRHLPAELRTALDLGPVPAFTGAKCADCASRFGLEYDHVDPVANGGLTEYSNIEPRCWKDHQDKTERDRKAGLLRGSARERSP